MLDFFFFKLEKAYERRISDWSSDVCSSYLRDCGLNTIASVVSVVGLRYSLSYSWGNVKWDQVTMLINRQRYQKTLRMSGVRRPYRLRAVLWLALSMSLVGCSGAERPTGSADAGPALRQSTEERRGWRGCGSTGC